MTIRRSSDRILQKQKERSDGFTAAQQNIFLGHFSATCNVQESARVAGVPYRRIYKVRERNPAFREAFALAEENGIVSLRAEMVRRSLELLAAATPDEVALASLPGLDCRTILHLLKYHEKGVGKGPGDRRPARSDAGEAAARLMKLMARMREEHKRELALKRAKKAALKAAANPSTTQLR